MESPLEKYLHLRYKPKRELFAGCEECPAFDDFDWVIWAPDAERFLRFRTLRPKRVLCLARRESLRTLVRLRLLLKDPILVVAGEDTRLSQVWPLVGPLVSCCSRIYFEAKDLRVSQVRSFSMGFISYYLNRVERDVIEKLVNDVSHPDWRKEGVLAAWGAIWKNLDETLGERRDAAEFVENSDWLERCELGAENYFKRLAESKYMVAPSGKGVQAPKLAEAWLMRTVPIVVANPCFEDLHNLGYPVVMLDRWSDLTPELLEGYEAERQRIDWEKVERMLTREFFRENILDFPASVCIGGPANPSGSHRSSPSIPQPSSPPSL